MTSILRLPTVYIMTNRKDGVLYTGITSNLIQRVWQHKEGSIEGFTKKYKCKLLIYYETTDEMAAAIQREKQIKGWLRSKKVALIEFQNPQWRDLYQDIL